MRKYNFFYSIPQDESIQERQIKKRKFKKNLRMISWFIAINALLGLIIACFMFIVEPRLRIKYIIIDNLQSIDENEVRDYLQIVGNELFFRIDTKILEERVTKHPAIYSARVMRRFPQTVRVHIQERKPLMFAMVPVNSEMHHEYIPVLIDKYGVFYRAVTAADDIHNIPLLSGVQFQNFQFGSKLPESMLQFLHEIEVLRTQNASLLSIFSEFRVISQRYRIELHAFTYQVPTVAFRITSITENMVKYMLRVLILLKDTDELKYTKEIDFRNDKIVYTKKGE